MKDHQLALLDRGQYPDRGVGLPVKMAPTDSWTATKDHVSAAAHADKSSKQVDLLRG